jgi:hypothetical protein
LSLLAPPVKECSIHDLPPVAKSQLTNDMQQRIKETMQAAAEEELGMAMIFSMITAAKVRVFLFHGKHRQQSSHTPRAVQELLMGDFSSEPAEEKKKEEAPQLPPEQRGTPVTKENFVTWNAPFMVELRGRSKQVVKTGLSGRELFEGGLWKEPEPEPDEEPMVELDDGAKNPDHKVAPDAISGVRCCWCKS